MTDRLHPWRATILLFVAVISLFTLSSCEDDDDYYINPIVGAWQMIAPAGDMYNEFEFYPDGSGRYYVEDYYGADTYQIEWDTNGNQLAVFFPYAGDSMFFYWSMSGSTLYLYPDGIDTPWVYAPF